MTEPIKIGFYEDIIIDGKTVRAKIDTGASTSSIDNSLASILNLGPVIKRSTVVSSNGKTVRPVFKLKIELAGKKIESKFNVASRKHLRYAVLIGKNIIRSVFNYFFFWFF